MKKQFRFSLFTVAFLLALFIHVSVMASTAIPLSDDYGAAAFAAEMDKYLVYLHKNTNIKTGGLRVSACTQDHSNPQWFRVDFNDRDSDAVVGICVTNTGYVDYMRFFYRGNNNATMGNIVNKIVAALCVCGIQPDEAARLVVAASQKGVSYIWHRGTQRNYVLMFKESQDAQGGHIAKFDLRAAVK